jgi:hypothetical protein
MVDFDMRQSLVIPSHPIPTPALPLKGGEGTGSRQGLK